MDIGTLNASNQVVWLDDKRQVYQGDDAIACCTYPFSIPLDGDFVVRFTVVHNVCLPCCISNCGGPNGRPMYSREIIMPSWENNQNVLVELNFITCVCC